MDYPVKKGEEKGKTVQISRSFNLIQKWRKLGQGMATYADSYLVVQTERDKSFFSSLLSSASVYNYYTGCH